MKNEPLKFEEFSKEMILHEKSVIDRAIAFLYFREVALGNPTATIQEIIQDFDLAGLPKPPSSRLKIALTRDKRTYKPTRTSWRIQKDKQSYLEERLRPYIYPIKKKERRNIPPQVNIGNPFDIFFGKHLSESKYIDEKLVAKIKKIRLAGFDLTRLIKMCDELNDASQRHNYISVILLVRAIIDHVPPLFGFKTFNEVQNNYNGAKSFKHSMEHLNSSSRNIADAYLHIPIRDSEVLPGKNQVNFSNDLDVLFSELVRIAVIKPEKS